MKKRFFVISLLLVVLIASSFMLSSCSYSPREIKYAYEIDNSIARMNGDKAYTEMKNNPDRGFSIRTYLTLPSPSNEIVSYAKADAFPKSEGSDKGATAKEYVENELKKFPDENPTATLLTVYLTELVGVNEIHTNALSVLNSYLRALRDINMTATVRFAYYHEGAAITPSADNIINHIASIKTAITSGIVKTAAKDSVTAIRTSFIGKDGDFEDTSAYSSSDVNKIVDACFRLSTDDIFSQTPNVSYKNNSSEYTKLIDTGFFNDNIETELNSFTSGGKKQTKKDYKQYVSQSLINYNTASLTVRSRSSIDGKAVIRQLKDGSFATLDISSRYFDSEGKDDVIRLWQNTPITKQELDDMYLPYYDEWFLNAEGASTNRTVYEYIRDFLGYNLSASNLKIEKKTTENSDGTKSIVTTVSFVITNYGLSAPLTVDKFNLIIRNNHTGKYLHTLNGVDRYNYDARILVSGGQMLVTQEINGDIDVVQSAPAEGNKGYSIGIQLFNDKASKDSYVRLNNDVPYENNVNWIYNYR